MLLALALLACDPSLPSPVDAGETGRGQVSVRRASRIEALTKQHDAQILVSHHVLQAAPGTDIKAQSIGEVAVRGREAPLALYKLA